MIDKAIGHIEVKDKNRYLVFDFTDEKKILQMKIKKY